MRFYALFFWFSLMSLLGHIGLCLTVISFTDNLYAVYGSVMLVGVTACAMGVPWEARHSFRRTRSPRGSEGGAGARLDPGGPRPGLRGRFLGRWLIEYLESTDDPAGVPTNGEAEDRRLDSE